jgi:hypothetical protein
MRPSSTSTFLKEFVTRLLEACKCLRRVRRTCTEPLCASFFLLHTSNIFGGAPWKSAVAFCTPTTSGLDCFLREMDDVNVSPVGSLVHPACVIRP